MTDHKGPREQTARGEDWPLYDNWWLGIHSEPHRFDGFDSIKIEALGPDGYKRIITDLMVPKIDGLVCESHSFISCLINQNIDAEKARADKATALLEHFFLESCHHTGEMRPGINREWCFDCASWVYEQDKEAISEARKFLAEYEKAKDTSKSIK